MPPRPPQQGCKRGLVPAGTIPPHRRSSGTSDKPLHKAGARSELKITNLSVAITERATQPWRGTGMGNVDTSGVAQLGIVTISTDQGVQGHSMVGGYQIGAVQAVKPLTLQVKPYLMGRNPLDVGGIWADLVRRVRSWQLDYAVIGAVDVALWDIAGKVAGLPVHRLLGTCRDRIPVYVSSANLPTPGQYGEEAASYRNRGMHGYKIHPHGHAQEDIAICAAVRQAVGPDFKLMLDPAARYNYTDAMRVGRAIEELDYYWYEEPMLETDLYGYTKLARDLDIPILAPETSPGGFATVGQWVTQGAADILRSDVARRGGITGMIKIAHLAEAFEMNCEVHTGGNSLTNVANLHVISAMPNTEFFELILPPERHQWGVVADLTPGKDGYLVSPSKPGLGVELDAALIKKHTVAVAE